jgi:polyribonucleotide nucleotidyltransferase
MKLWKQHLQARDGRLHILGKLIETHSKMLKRPKNITRRILMLSLVPLTWWKSDSRITKATGTTIVINEDPILKSY